MLADELEPTIDELEDLVPSKIGDKKTLKERRVQLVEAATDLFLSKGFHETSIRDIANAVGWNMGTLYLYISSKIDILFLINKALLEKMRSVVISEDHYETAREALYLSMERFFRMCDRMKREVRLMYRERQTLFDGFPQYPYALRKFEVRWFFHDIIKRGMRDGEFRHLDPVIVTQNIIMAGHTWPIHLETLQDYFEITFEDYMNEQLELIMYMVLARD